MKKDRHGINRPADMKQVERIRAKLAMVFQQFNLWSHLTILQNVIEAPVHVLKVPKAEAIERARHYLEKVGIPDKQRGLPGPSLRRPAAACGHRPGPGHGTGSDPL